jgi:DNA invertase Pin-like site-specific DNA recombinase
MNIGYARCSTDKQDLAAQVQTLRAMGVPEENIYSDYAKSGTKLVGRDGLDRALACARSGDTLMVPKLDRLARSVRDFHTLIDGLTSRGVTVQIGTMTYDPDDPMGQLLIGQLALFAEFEASMIRMRTREGMAIAKAKGHLRGKQPKLSAAKRAHLLELAGAGEHNVTELAELFSVSRPTVYRELAKAASA